MRQEEVARGGRRSKRRGSANNARRLDAFRDKSSAKGMADWGDAPPELIAGVVIASQRMGGAVTFGLSRDGGAHMLTLLLDGERETLWFNGDADLDEALRQVIAVLETMAD